MKSKEQSESQTPKRVSAVRQSKKSTNLRSEKIDFIIKYIEKHGHTNVLNSIFVDKYIEKFPMSNVEYMPIGSHVVPEIGRLLSDLYKKGKLKRFIIGLDHWQPGFPKWVYSYEPI